MKKILKKIFAVVFSLVLTIVRFFALKLKEKPVFLVMDRTTAAGDNGEAMLRYLDTFDEYDTYMVLSDKCADSARLEKDYRLVNMFSFRYWVKFLQADVIFVSGRLWRPKYHSFYLRKKIDYKLVFLQHGVTKEDISAKYNASCGYDLVITATKAEFNEWHRPAYGFSENQVALTGFARYDRLYNNRKKIITVGLTWRLYLRNKDSDEFFGSEYFEMLKSLLIDPEFIDLAEKYGYKVRALLHPEIGYKMKHQLFEVFDKRVMLSVNESYTDIFADSSLLITDYSSMAFDMAYLKKPVLYYQQDYEEFFSGKHTLVKGYFNCETDGFGQVLKSKADLLAVTEEYLTDDCKMKEEYVRRVDATFEYADKNNCKRIMDAVKERFLKD